MKKFFGEFKKFITRGNVLDMSVGVIVGGAFTGIVNGLSNFILKPIINWILALILGTGGLEGVVTFLSQKFTTDANGNQVVDLANSIFIDWGSFISAIINFILIALVLFTIVKVINKMKEENATFSKKIKKHHLSKDERKDMKARGLNPRKRKDALAYIEIREKEMLEAEEKAKQEAEEKARQDRLANPTVEDLLKDIKVLLEKTVKE